MRDSEPELDFTPTQLRLLLGSIFIIAVCSLLYELLISSLSTYLLGSSVVHYSVTIGLFLFFMGIGAWLSKYIESQLVAWFVGIEIVIGIVGGLSALLLFFVFAWTELYYPIMVLVIASISILIGMEIPLLTRLFERSEGLRKGISEIMAVDYIGALFASLLFPFVLLPYFGHLLTATATGLLNLVVACVVAYHFRHWLGRTKVWLLASIIFGYSALGIAFYKSNAAANLLTQALYQDTVIHSEQSQYQKIVVTQWGDDTRLFLNGNLQFSSVDEYRYHEVISHVPAAYAKRRNNALVIGGGDGLAIRELLRYPELEEIQLVDIDPAVSQLSRTMSPLRALTNNALEDPRLSVAHKDAWVWLGESGTLYDLIIIDLPDPGSEDTARLYTVAFYERVARRLATGGVMMTQATSPWFARKAYWSIGETLEEVFPSVKAASVYVPSFGLWGFFMASSAPLDNNSHPVMSGRFVNEDTLVSVFDLDPDIRRVDVEPNRIGSLVLLDYYSEGWDFVNRGIAVAP